MEEIDIARRAQEMVERERDNSEKGYIVSLLRKIAR